MYIRRRTYASVQMPQCTKEKSDMNRSACKSLFGWFFLIVLTFPAARVFGQTYTTTSLAEAIVKECPAYYLPRKSACSGIDETEIRNRLEDGEIYLKNLLKSFVLSDTSRSFEEQKEILRKLNEKYDVHSVDDPVVSDKFEKQYLLLSVLKVHTCDEYFDKLIQHYYGKDGFRPSCAAEDTPESTVSGSDGSCVPSESLLIFKTWLTDLLIDRFQTETDSFNWFRAVNFYNWMTLFSSKPFEGDLEDENELFHKLNDWAAEAVKGDYLYQASSREELSAKTYRARSSVLTKWNADIQDSAVFKYTEHLLLLSMQLLPDPAVAHNLGVTYYNYAMSLYKALDHGVFHEDSSAVRNRADSLSAVGLELYEKALKELEIDK